MKRLLIVARRIWPCTNDASLRLRRLAQQLAGEQWRSTIVTPRWHSSWPSRVMLEQSVIRRIDAPPISALRQIRYLQNLKQWVAQHVNEFQAVYCDQADWDAEVVLNCFAGRRVPAVVRLEIGDAENDRSELVVRACSQATAVLVPTQTTHQKAIALGLSAQRLVRFFDYNVPSVPRSEAARRETQKILSEINGDLHLSRSDRLIVVPGELNNRWNNEFVIRSIGRFIEDQPNLRLWLLGAGPNHGLISDLLREQCIHRYVALPGVFTSIEPVLQAADLCLFPGRDCGLSFLLPTCIQSGIPFLASRTAELENILGSFISEISFNGDTTSELNQKVQHWWNSPSDFEETARSIQRFFRTKYASSTSGCSLSERMRLLTSCESEISLKSFHDRLRPAR